MARHTSVIHATDKRKVQQQSHFSSQFKKPRLVNFHIYTDWCIFYWNIKTTEHNKHAVLFNMHVHCNCEKYIKIRRVQGKNIGSLFL